MYTIDYYHEANGSCPIRDFIDSLDPKMRAKIFGRLELLEEHGANLGMPFARLVTDGIYELRTVCHGDTTRILYFFVYGKRIILTNGFKKKTQKTPSGEIEKAMRMRKDWKARNERL